MQIMNSGSSRSRILIPALAAGIILWLAACNSTGDSSGAPSGPEPGSPTMAVPTAIEAPAGSTTATPGTKPSSTQAGELPTATGGATAAPTAAVAAALPDPSSAGWREVATDLDRPIGLASAPEVSDTMFVLEQSGRIQKIGTREGGVNLYLDISDRVGSNGSERGLLGLAFHPQFSVNGFFYVNYTDLNGDTVISRFQGNADRADPRSERILLQVDQPYANHNGGHLVFGPDNYLYIALGDGGSAGDPHGNGQSLETRLGKILRIDVDHGDPFAIPADNPYASENGKVAEIWHYGLRNPWRFSFDRQNSDLYIADVGQGEWEEIDWLPAGTPGGVNFGWDLREGAHPFQGGDAGSLDVVDPVWEYNHSEGCSVTGGVVYRGQALPAWQGTYLFADYCSGRVWGLRQIDSAWQGVLLYQTDFRITSFGEDLTGEVYLADHQGSLYRLE